MTITNAERWVHKGTITSADERVYGVWNLNADEQIGVLAEPDRRPGVRLGVGDKGGGHHVLLSVEDARDIGWALIRAANQVEDAQEYGVSGHSSKPQHSGEIPTP